MVKTTSNKSTLKKLTYTMLAAAVVSGGLLSPLHTTPVVAANNVQIAAGHSQFKDVGTSHFAYEAVHWAKKKGIVDGYSDGRFGPNDDVTEGQFAKMITEYFGLKDSGGKLTKTQGGAVWTDAYYNKLAGYGVPLNGYYDNVIRNKVVKRGTVAQTLAYLAGYSMGLEDSINFLLDNKVTVGQNSAHKNDIFKYFGTQNNLSRAQVVTFLYRMNNNDLSKISADAVVMFKNDSGYSLNDSAKIAKNKIDKSLAQDAVSTPSKPVTPPPVVSITEEKNGVTTYSKNGETSSFNSSKIDYNVSEENKKPKNDAIKSENLNKDYTTTKTTKNGKNKITPKFEGKISKKFDLYTIADNDMFLVENGKKKTVFSYSINKYSNLYNEKGSSTYSTESISLRNNYYLSNKEDIIKVIQLTGFKLTEEEIIECMKKVGKLGEFEQFMYKEYRFIRNMDDLIFIEKTV